MQTFDNHPPLNFDNLPVIARAARDGGSYDGIGHNKYRVVQGKKIHLWHSHSSGCSYNNRTDLSREHMGCFASMQELIAHLLGLPTAWWINELLDDLGFEGAEA